MPSFNKFYSFVEAVCEKKHNLGSDTLKLMLSDTAPSASNSIKADITEITPGNGYVAGGVPVTVTSSSQTSGTYKLVCSDTSFTASGGSMAAFQYAVLYNDSAPSKELIGWWDIGSPITLAATEVFPIDFSSTNGVLQLA